MFFRNRTIYGLVFLFNYSKKERQNRNNNLDSQLKSDKYIANNFDWRYFPKLFFARQIATNSCSTHALVSIVLNIPDRMHVDLGTTLTNAKIFLLGVPPEDRGNSLQMMEELRIAHNSFTKFEYI